MWIIYFPWCSSTNICKPFSACNFVYKTVFTPNRRICDKILKWTTPSHYNYFLFLLHWYEYQSLDIKGAWQCDHWLWWCANTHCIMNKSTCSQEHRGDTMLHHTCSMAWRLSQSMWDSLSSSQCYNRYITLLTRSLPGQRVWWKRWLEWRTVLSSLAHSVDEPSLRHYPTLPDNHSLHLALSPPTGVCLLTGPLVVLQVERNSWNELLLLALERV